MKDAIEPDKALKVLLERLHAAEHDLELANALRGSYQLNDAEMILNEAINKIERVRLCHCKMAIKPGCPLHDVRR